MARAKQPVSIDGLEFDALISTNETLSATVPSYAVEDGYSVSDSIIINAQSISMTLCVTNTPVTWYKRHGASPTRVADVEKKLRQLYFNKTPVTVITTDETYTDMAIESISFSKSVDSANSREIPITLKKIQVTTAKTTTIPSSYGKSGTSGASAGTANTTAANTSSETKNEKKTEDSGSKSSILYSVGKSLGLV